MFKLLQEPLALTHYSDVDSFVLSNNRPLTAPGAKPDMKPAGLWVSVDGEYDWKWWCEGEKFRLEKLRYRHRVTINPDARVLHLSSAADIDDFSEAYKVPLTSYAFVIDWGEVARQYDGIVIAPYIWSRRLDGGHLWYYGWDCASGCIWNLDAIQSFERVGN